MRAVYDCPATAVFCVSLRNTIVVPSAAVETVIAILPEPTAVLPSAPSYAKVRVTPVAAPIVHPVTLAGNAPLVTLYGPLMRALPSRPVLVVSSASVSLKESSGNAVTVSPPVGASESGIDGGALVLNVRLSLYALQTLPVSRPRMAYW